MQTFGQLFRFLRSIGLAFVLSLALFYLIMQPPMGDLAVMIRLMLITTLVSVIAAFGAYRLGWIYRSPHLRLTLILGSLLAGVLLFLNVLVIASMMFASQHDLQLAAILLVFASGITISVGYFLAEAITDRIQILCQAARQIAAGDLSQRVVVNGKDEMADLALRFNEMAAHLQTAQQKQQELDTLRSDLIAWVSHDLRTPLTSIRAILEALADGVVEDPQTQQRYLRTAQQDIRTLSHLIDDLFIMSQVDAGGLTLDQQNDSIGDLISDTIESFSELAERQQVKLEGCLNPGVDPVWMDSRKLGRVLNNLVSNALRHTPAGGIVSICASRQGDQILVEVTDTGEGISSADLPHVFDRFYRGEKSRSRATGGSGLGLAIARGIVAAHGGTISVENKKKQGSRFYFTLPGKPPA